MKEGKSQFFMPFEMKPCMRLAPAHRVTDFSTQVRDKLDQCLQEQVQHSVIVVITVQPVQQQPYGRDKTGPSCSKHPELNKLITGQNVNCSSKYNI